MDVLYNQTGPFKASQVLSCAVKGFLKYDVRSNLISSNIGLQKVNNRDIVF